MRVTPSHRIVIEEQVEPLAIANFLQSHHVGAKRHDGVCGPAHFVSEALAIVRRWRNEILKIERRDDEPHHTTVPRGNGLLDEASPLAEILIENDVHFLYKRCMRFSWLICAFPMVAACTVTSVPPPSSTSELEGKVATQYAVIVSANYKDALDGAMALKTKIDAFTASPSEASLTAAKDAWIKARDVYGQTESFRFYDGPIDNEKTGVEGRVNGWPLDEQFIDYVEGSPEAGIVNHPDLYATITKAVIAENNEKGEGANTGEKNISTGWHAIEFLLWGQDQSKTGPGARPHTDFVDGGTAKNQTRRREYLKAAVELLVEDLTTLYKAWDTSDKASYASTFIADAPKTNIQKMMLGITSLIGFETSRERLYTAFTTKDQEEEHSCFSDNTRADLVANVLAIENVYLGRYGSNDGVGLTDLVRNKDATLDDRIKANMTKSLAAVRSIPLPFDQAILGDNATEGGKAITASIDAMNATTEDLLQAARVLEVTVNIAK